MPENLENLTVATGLEKVSFHSYPKERQCRERSNYCTIALISHASKVKLKILQASLQQNVNHELPYVQAGFRKGTRKQRSNYQHLLDHRESKGIPENIYFCFIDYSKGFDCVNHNKLENS